MELCSNANSFRSHAFHCARHKCKRSTKRDCFIFNWVRFESGVPNRNGARGSIGIWTDMASGNKRNEKEKKVDACINWCDRDSLRERRKKAHQIESNSLIKRIDYNFLSCRSLSKWNCWYKLLLSNKKSQLNDNARDGKKQIGGAHSAWKAQKKKRANLFNVDGQNQFKCSMIGFHLFICSK